jgi:hypothetical protein
MVILYFLFLFNIIDDENSHRYYKMYIIEEANIFRFYFVKRRKDYIIMIINFRFYLRISLLFCYHNDDYTNYFLTIFNTK